MVETPKENTGDEEAARIKKLMRPIGYGVGFLALLPIIMRWSPLLGETVDFELESAGAVTGLLFLSGLSLGILAVVVVFFLTRKIKQRMSIIAISFFASLAVIPWAPAAHKWNKDASLEPPQTLLLKLEEKYEVHRGRRIRANMGRRIRAKMGRRAKYKVVVSNWGGKGRKKTIDVSRRAYQQISLTTHRERQEALQKTIDTWTGTPERKAFLVKMKARGDAPAVDQADLRDRRNYCVHLKVQAGVLGGLYYKRISSVPVDDFTLCK